MKEKCPTIQEWRVIALSLRKHSIKSVNNQQSAIVRDIAHIRFPRLMILILGDNRIQSIENLCRLWMPLLAEFYLC